MHNLRIRRRRIRSVQNTAKITKAMQMIASSKMRRAQQLTRASRPYADKMRDVLADLAAQPAEVEEIHPLLQQREVRNIQVIHVTPDRGLCGGLNANLNRTTGQFIRSQSVPVNVITVGRKGRDFMVRANSNVRAVFIDLGDRPTVMYVSPVARLAIDGYTTGDVDQVFITYTQFVNTAVQRSVMERLLPVEPAALEPSQAVGYIYEPLSLTVLGSLLPRFVEMQIYHALLENLASEHSARMVAMRAATDNANDMVDGLTLMLNKARQETISRELLDIVGGVAALEA